MYILTEEYNDYDQHGEYFVAAWLEKPSYEQLLLKLGEGYGEYSNQQIIENLLRNGGGRIDSEYCWYWLREYYE